jgi:hypothetical protein
MFPGNFAGKPEMTQEHIMTVTRKPLMSYGDYRRINMEPVSPLFFKVKKFADDEPMQILLISVSTEQLANTLRLDNLDQILSAACQRKIDVMVRPYQGTSGAPVVGLWQILCQGYGIDGRVLPDLIQICSTILLSAVRGRKIRVAVEVSASDHLHPSDLSEATPDPDPEIIDDDFSGPDFSDDDDDWWRQ